LAAPSASDKLISEALFAGFGWSHNPEGPGILLSDAGPLHCAQQKNLPTTYFVVTHLRV
jgi:hypothetical protein